jgi:hypothetical protein
MKLYRSKVPVIAAECIRRLVEDGDIEVVASRIPAAEADLAAIMEDYLRRDGDLREATKEHMHHRGMSYDQTGKVRSAFAEERQHPLGEDVERYLARQFAENLMISPSVDEVFAEDKDIYKKMLGILKGNDIDEAGLREEARGKIKNVREGSVEYEIALNNALREVKKRHGLL